MRGCVLLSALPSAEGPGVPQEPRPGGGHGPRPGCRETDHPHGCPGPRHCPWCCHTAGGRLGPSQMPTSTAGGPPHPSPASPQPPRPSPEPGRGAALSVKPPAAAPASALAGPRSPQIPLPGEKLPLGPRWVESQNCFLNWYFPVERTSYAFFTCVIELPNVFVFEKT